MLKRMFLFLGKVNCKWSNENCDSEEECYSGRCIKLHDGTDARCSSSPIHKPCFFSYQCENGLSCGEFYLCCSPYWGVCKETKDCCDDNHVCRPEEYFTYKRCLPPNRAGTIVLSNNLLILTTTSIIMFISRTRYAIF